MIRYLAERVEDTRAFAARFARVVVRALDDAPGASLVVGLTGELGAGKTEFARGFMAGLDPARAEAVTSPTYAIVQLHPGTPPVRHMDLYRLESLPDLEAIGYREHFFEPGVALVEWIDTVPDAIPREWVQIALAVQPTDVREIHLHPHGERWTRAVRELIP